MIDIMHRLQAVEHINFADDFLEELGVCLDMLDEMDSVVSGANFLLQVSVSP